MPMKDTSYILLSLTRMGIWLGLQPQEITIQNTHTQTKEHDLYLPWV